MGQNNKIAPQRVGERHEKKGEHEFQRKEAAKKIKKEDRLNKELRRENRLEVGTGPMSKEDMRKTSKLTKDSSSKAVRFFLAEPRNQRNHRLILESRELELELTQDNFDIESDDEQTDYSSTDYDPTELSGSESFYTDDEDEDEGESQDKANDAGSQDKANDAGSQDEANDEEFKDESNDAGSQDESNDEEFKDESNDAGSQDESNDKEFQEEDKVAEDTESSMLNYQKIYERDNRERDRFRDWKNRDKLYNKEHRLSKIQEQRQDQTPVTLEESPIRMGRLFDKKIKNTSNNRDQCPEFSTLNP